MISCRSVKEMQATTKTDVVAFGVVLAELTTGQRALIRDNQAPNKMKSLITVVSEQNYPTPGLYQFEVHQTNC